MKKLTRDRVVPFEPRHAREKYPGSYFERRGVSVRLACRVVRKGGSKQEEDFGTTELVVENNIEQRTVDLQSAFYAAGVLNETQFPEPVHEKAHP